ncbi:TetR/AcrR family transcriptional regulator [Actinoplanes sp. LDG1-06]|uniref:TetR/AcrR family transcriptional regulator n=1 Tax=Paractinoplanes ovalisporus TaxID=2810368 RepID=A0ABS2AKV7_9ACTN|nr:TetR/AcrR family transcriptional regulator [Actinoplanes ovalisporus]MBM2620469.1 TetR/AcrR family transcriptional regulator [Actinoplanes ovalisporus]
MSPTAAGRTRRTRADAQRNIDALVDAAREVFAASGPDAPVREIAARAGVGLATFYRHFPERADLITAVFRQDVDACADAATELRAEHDPFEALVAWVRQLTGFLGGRRGLAVSVHAGDPAFVQLPAYFRERFEPTLGALLEAAADAGEIRGDVDPGELLGAIKRLCSSGDSESNERMVALVIDGLRFGHDTR